ncbi:glycoside hydrolase family 31 protein [Bacillus horti]|uniref:Alpha-glucosidase n=1 Tax=Caldalkalibacillus horti TaxID=77523 RepID=A0ABT9W2N4_9BACI|nr:glycoside hydrolase family 31 protein [Bacillus horti]MDQ0167512.1 alpha-glucosidase [Bacillus horti]
MLQDTSFAIHPGKLKDNKGDELFDIGSVESLSVQNDIVSVKTKTGEVAISFFNAHTVRITANPFGAATLKTSPAVVGQSKPVELQIVEEDMGYQIKTEHIHVYLRKSPIRIQIMDANGRVIVTEQEKGMAYKANGEVICYKKMESKDHFYGFGEKPGGLNKRGDRMEMWNTDMYAPHNPETDTLYQSIPFFVSLRDGAAHGLYFDNTWRTAFDMKNDPEYYSFASAGGQIDYYVFVGPAIKEVITQYTTLTGRAPIPPKWSLGYHQSRYSYETAEEVRTLVKTFKEKGIPLDVVHLDIHYMDGYRVFTFDGNRFPDAKELVQELKEQGVHIVPIVDPGVKVDPEYAIYQEGVREDYFCKYIEGNIYNGEVWPGVSAFPDFTEERVREWWGEKQRFYSDIGIEGIWNDMNEPAVFNETKTMDVNVIHGNDGDPKTHRELHNLYGFRMTQSTYEGQKKNLQGNRPFVLTRAGFAGIQRYAAVWTGDNRSFWEHLQLSLPMVMNLGLSGVPFSGPDVGGFDFHANGELLTRWTQVGVFTPFFRNHSAISADRQEPWSFGEEYEKIIAAYIRLRYQWLPQLYTMFREAHEDGLPVMRPLVLEYPEDSNTHHLQDQFMLGSNVIVAPVITPKTEHRVVYLPEGEWVDYWNNDLYTGGQHHLVKAPLDKLPIFIKKGSFIVLGDTKENTKEKDDNRYVHCYYDEGKSFAFTHYEDDGKTFSYEQGEWRKTTFTAHCEAGVLNMTVESNGDYQDGKKKTLFIHQANYVEKVFVNDKQIDFTQSEEGILTVSLSE